MAEKPPPKETFMQEFGWFIWGIVGIGILWFFTGGPSRPEAHEGAYIKPLGPVDTGEIYGDYYAGQPYNPQTKLDLPRSPIDIIKDAQTSVKGFFAQSEEAKQIHIGSILSKSISLDGRAQAKSSDPNEEYLRIISSEQAKNPVYISGLFLRGYGFDTNVAIPKAANLPLLGVTTPETDVLLPPGGRALITTGRSPIGASFRVNMCSGYLDQFQTYSPGLRNLCPDPMLELRRKGLGGDSSCANFVDDLPHCEAFDGTVPSHLSSACRAFLTDTLTYNSCALAHKDDKGFYQNEWRIFLEETKEIWRNSDEIIKLTDQNGNTIDAITY